MITKDEKQLQNGDSSEKSLHTPGPWRVHTEEAEGVFNNSYRIEYGGVFNHHGGTVICRTPTGLGGKYLANAALIAAAPNMLRALKMFAHNYNLGAIQPEDNPQTIVGAIFSAIAKAEGRTE